jgi:hypothetical protein
VPTKVRLTRKFAEIINGIDLSRARAGEELELSARDAQMLIAEGWAAPIDTAHDKPIERRRKARKRGPALN